MSTKTAKTPKLMPSWDLVNPNLELVREHYVTIMYLYVLPGLLGMLGSVLLGDPTVENGHLTMNSSQATGLIITLVAFAWQLVNIGPSIYFQLRAVKGKAGTLREYYRHGLKFSWRVILYYMAYGCMAFGGLLLFIVPGLIVIRRYLLGSYYLVDNNYGVGDALKRSAKTSKPISGVIWGTLGVQGVFIAAALLFEWSLGVTGSVLSLLTVCSSIFLMPLRYREIIAAR